MKHTEEKANSPEVLLYKTFEHEDYEYGHRKNGTLYLAMFNLFFFLNNATMLQFLSPRTFPNPNFYFKLPPPYKSNKLNNENL